MTNLAYIAGWVLLVASLIFRVVVPFSMGAQNFVSRTSLWPHNLFQLSMIAFVICIASYCKGRAEQK